MTVLYHSTTLTCSQGLQPCLARACIRGCIARHYLASGLFNIGIIGTSFLNEVKKYS